MNIDDWTAMPTTQHARLVSHDGQHCLMMDVPTQIVPLPEVPTQALLRGQAISVDATQAQRHHFAHNTGCGKRAAASVP